MSKRGTSVGIRELKDHASEVLRRVRSGETVVVTDRNEPVARIVPIATAPDDDAARSLVAEGKVAWAGGKPRGAKRRVPVVGPSVAEAVIEDRR